MVMSIIISTGILTSPKSYGSEVIQFVEPYNVGTARDKYGFTYTL